MSRVRLCLLGVLAVVMVGAVSASSASAAFELTIVPCEKGEIINLCWAETAESVLLELKGEEPFTAKLDEGEALLLAKVGTTEIHITCTEATGEGTFVQKEPLIVDYSVKSLVLKFTGCKLLEPVGPSCVVPNEIKTKKIDGEPFLDEGEKLSEEAITFLPEEVSGVFAEIPITGEKCVLKGTNIIVKGRQQCLWIEPLVDLLEHLIHCLHSESLLTVGEQKAEFELLVVVKPINLGSDLWDIEEVL